ncbi:MAG: ActS/PrrB/RegB family redox-sensitive histidine kinase [Notoacmeibacter sp.]|nr:ActS/PrrB/RegB family redox-sensitive histidine kinase [Notoacmeibacter sp.]
MEDIHTHDALSARRLRLDTLIRLRWLAVAGQSAAVLLVHFWLGFSLPVMLCFALIGLSAWLNIFLALRFPSTFRLAEWPSLGLLTFDVLQLSGLLYMTGGMTNPFVILLTAPVIVSATSLPVRMTLVLGAIVLASASILTYAHMPLPWFDGAALDIPFLYIAGMWVAVVSSLVFTAVYAWRVADEAGKLAAALTAVELVLQREQHLSALDGLAAAAAHELGTPLATIALVAREMEREVPEGSPLREDIELVRSQSQRCREIMQRLTSLSSEGDRHIARMELSVLMDEVAQPHRAFDTEIAMLPKPGPGGEPVFRRNPGILYGLGNLVENAVDFAAARVELEWSWDAKRIWIRIADDGPGFAPEILARIGEPYTSKRHLGDRSTGGGLGLGMFIAKTLLERSGASLVFSNDPEGNGGAQVMVSWLRSSVEMQPQEATI